MMDCEAVQDRMPLVVHGGPTWTEAEAAHLASCADCAAGWRVVQTAARLGDAAARRVDPEHISAAVLSQLARDRRSTRWIRGGWLTGLAAAAAVVLLVWGGEPRHRPGPETAQVAPSGTQELRVPLAELENLDAAQLESVLEGLDAPLGSQAAPDAPHLGDLDDSQLERVLRSLEG